MFSSIFGRGLAGALTTLAAGALAPVRAASPEVVAPTLIEQHLMAQEGMSIGLATMDLESQVDAYIYTAFFGSEPGVCQLLSSGGSAKVVSADYSNPFSIKSHVQIFFDTACKSLFLDETLQLNYASASPVTYNFPATATLYSRTHAKVATLTLSNKLVAVNPTTIKLSGLGTLSPVGSAAKIKVGLTCAVPVPKKDFALPPAKMLAGALRSSPFMTPPQPDASDINCTEGVSQTFGSIAKSAAALTPLTLHLVYDPVSGNTRVTFKQATPAKLYVGAPNALSIAVNAAGTVSVTGPKVLYASVTLSGQAANLVLFPPMPVNWTVVDAAHGTKFAIALLSNATRQLSGKITNNQNATLATIASDQGGTGTIVYSNHASVAIRAWSVLN